MVELPPMYRVTKHAWHSADHMTTAKRVSACIRQPRWWLSHCGHYCFLDHQYTTLIISDELNFGTVT